MSIGAYDLVTMLEVLHTYKAPKVFWLQFFPRQINFTSEKIAFDRVNHDYRRMAPLVSPNAQGKIYGLEGYDTVEFKPAYVKPKHIVDPETPFVRRAGETPISGTLSPMQRRDAAVADILYRHAQMHLMRWEWMAARATIDGKVTLTGENYPTTVIDFRRNAALTVVLTGTAKWDAPSTATPLADIYASRTNVNTLNGSVVQDIVFGRDAWAAFAARSDVRELMNKNYDGVKVNVSLIADNFEDGYEYLGTIAGSNGNGTLRLWLYSGKYYDESTGVLTDILDAGTIVGVSPALAGVRCFGAIKDKKAGYQALEMFPKMWEEEDPSVEYVMTQGAPLMVPRDPNGSFSIKVL